MNKFLNEEALIKRARPVFVFPYYLTNRSFKEEQIDGSQDSVCSWSLVVFENQLVTLLDLGLFGDTEGCSSIRLLPRHFLFKIFSAVKIFSIALPNTYKQNRFSISALKKLKKLYIYDKNKQFLTLVNITMILYNNLHYIILNQDINYRISFHNYTISFHFDFYLSNSFIKLNFLLP